MADDVTLKLGAEAQQAIDTLERVQKSLVGIVDTVKKATPVYDAYGTVVSNATEKASQGTDKAKKSSSLLDEAWTKMTAAFTASALIERGIDAIVDLGAGAVETASRILDLHESTGLSVEGLQRLEYVEAATNTQQGALANSAYQLSLRLAGGDDSVRQAVADLGLGYEQLMALSPEDRFLVMTNVLRGVDDTTRRNTDGVALFGKQWKDVAPAVVAGIEQIGRSAVTSSQQQLQSISDAQAALNSLLHRTQEAATNAAGAVALSIEQHEKGYKTIFAGDPIIGAAIRIWDSYTGSQKNAATATGQASQRLQDLTNQVKGGTPPVVDYQKELAELQAKVKGLTAEQKAQIDAGLAAGHSTKDIADTTKIATGVVDLYRDAVQQQKQAQDEARRQDDARRDALRELNSSLSDLTNTQIEQIATLLRAGKSEGDIAKAYGYTSTQVRAVRDQEKQRADALAEQLKDITDDVAAQYKAQADATENAQRKAAEFYDYWQDLQDRVAIARAEASDREFAQQEIDYRKDVELLKERTAGDAETFTAGMEALQTIYEQKTLELLGHNTMLADGNQKAAKETTAAWSDGLGRVSHLLDQVGRSSDDGFGVFLRDAAKAIDVAGQLADSIQAIKNNTETAATMMSGAMAVISGTQFAAQVAEGLEEPAWVTRTREIGQRWGVHISRGLAEQLSDEAAQSDITMALLNTEGTDKILERASVERRAMLKDALNLDKIMADVGLDAQNMDAWIERAAPLYDAIAQGGDVAGIATKTLTSLLQQFGEQAQKTGGLWSQSFKDMLAKARELGVGLDEIQDIVSGQLDIVRSSTEGVVSGLTDEVDRSFKSTTDKAFQLIEDTYGAGSQGDAARAEATKAANADIVANYQEEFDRVSAITLTSFNAYIAQGHSSVEASREFGASIDQLTAAADKFGFAGGAAYNELARWRTLTSENEPLLTQIGSLNSLTQALENINGLTAESFQNIQAQGETAYQRLLAAGFTEQEALAQMKPLLETVRRLHDEKNYAVDEGTQKLLDQAEANGVLGKAEESQQDILKEGLGAIITALDGDLPEAWKKTAQAAKDAADDIHDNATKKIQGGLGTVEDQLGDRNPWIEWARNAKDAARDVADEVDHLNFGHSPGGLKEIPLLLGKSERAAGSWRNDLLEQLGAAQRAVDSFQAPGLVAGGDGVAAAATFSGGVGDTWNGPREVHLHVPMADGTERVEVIDLVAEAFAQGRLQVPARSVTPEAARG